jgi:hypothetical protein
LKISQVIIEGKNKSGSRQGLPLIDKKTTIIFLKKLTATPDKKVKREYRQPL